MIKKRNENKKLIFDDYRKFKKKLWWVFRVVNKKWTAEQHIYILWQNKLVIKYSTEFQWIMIFIKWNNETLTSQYYWELKDTIKNKIVRMNRLENFQRMIHAFINIDSWQWKWWMKHTEY